MPMASLVSHAAALPYEAASVPVLFRFSEDDTVVRPDLTHDVARRWGGPVTKQMVTAGEPWPDHNLPAE